MAETIKVYNDNGEEAEFYVLEQTRLGLARIIFLRLKTLVPRRWKPGYLSR